MTSETPPKRKYNYTKKTGKPSSYNQEIADLICQRVATNSIGIRRLCSMYDDMPNCDTINEWRWKHREFAEQYRLAKQMQSELGAEECLEIADDAAKDTTTDKQGNEICNTEWVARSKLRIDTRKWLAAKLAPKIYGDSLNRPEKEDDKSEIEKMISGSK